jgi:hypothetical protein
MPLQLLYLPLPVLLLLQLQLLHAGCCAAAARLAARSHAAAEACHFESLHSSTAVSIVHALHASAAAGLRVFFLVTLTAGNMVQCSPVTFVCCCHRLPPLPLPLLLQHAC